MQTLNRLRSWRRGPPCTHVHTNFLEDGFTLYERRQKAARNTQFSGWDILWVVNTRQAINLSKRINLNTTTESTAAVQWLNSSMSRTQSALFIYVEDSETRNWFLSLPFSRSLLNYLHRDSYSSFLNQWINSSSCREKVRNRLAFIRKHQCKFGNLFISSSSFNLRSTSPRKSFRSITFVT